jgi:hypothetical protein
MIFACPVPSHQCSGTIKQIEPGSKTGKVHHSRDETKKCVSCYYVSLGYTAMPNREFHKDGCPVIVMHKNPGGRLRKGKGIEGDKKARRVMFRSCHRPFKCG